LSSCSGEITGHPKREKAKAQRFTKRETGENAHKRCYAAPNKLKEDEGHKGRKLEIFHIKNKTYGRGSCSGMKNENHISNFNAAPSRMVPVSTVVQF